MSMPREFQLAQDLFNLFADYFNLHQSHQWRELERQPDFRHSLTTSHLVAMFVFVEMTHLTVLIERTTGASTFTLPFAGGERMVGREVDAARALTNAFKRFYFPDKTMRVDWEVMNDVMILHGRERVVELFQNALRVDPSKLGLDITPSGVIVGIGPDRYSVTAKPQT